MRAGGEMKVDENGNCESPPVDFSALPRFDTWPRRPETRGPDTCNILDQQIDNMNKYLTASMSADDSEPSSHELRLQKVKDALAAVTELEKSMNFLKTWFGHVETQLSAPLTFSTFEDHEFNNILDQYHELHSDIIAHTDNVRAVSKLSDVLLSDSDVASSPQPELTNIRAFSRLLDKKWASITSQSQDRLNKINRTWERAKKFSQTCDSYEQFLQQKSSQLDELDSETADTIGRSELIASEIEKVSQELTASLEKLDLASQQYRNISDGSRDCLDLSSTLRSRLENLNKTWSALSERCESQLKNIKRANQQSGEIEQSRQSLMMWLMDVDIRLTSIDLLSPQLPDHDKLERIAEIQRDIEVHASRVEYLKMLCRKARTAISDVDQLKRFDSEVADFNKFHSDIQGRVVRLQTKLIRQCGAKGRMPSSSSSADNRRRHSRMSASDMQLTRSLSLDAALDLVMRRARTRRHHSDDQSTQSSTVSRSESVSSLGMEEDELFAHRVTETEHSSPHDRLKPPSAHCSMDLDWDHSQQHSDDLSTNSRLDHRNPYSTHIPCLKISPDDLEIGLRECGLCMDALQQSLLSDILTGEASEPSTKRFSRQLSSCEAAVESVVAIHDKVALGSGGALETQRSRVDELVSRWNELKPSAVERYGRLKTNLQLWYQFLGDMRALTEWVSESERVLLATPARGAKLSLRHLEQLVRRHREFLSSVDGHKTTLMSVNMFLDQPESCAPSRDLRMEVEQLNVAFSALCSRASAWQQQLLTYVVISRDVRATIGDICEWVSEIEDSLSTAEELDDGQPIKILQQKFSVLRMLQSEVECHWPRVQSLKSSLDILLVEPQSSESKTIKQQLFLIMSRIDSFNPRIESAIDRSSSTVNGNEHSSQHTNSSTLEEEVHVEVFSKFPVVSAVRVEGLLGDLEQASYSLPNLVQTRGDSQHWLGVGRSISIHKTSQKDTSCKLDYRYFLLVLLLAVFLVLLPAKFSGLDPDSNLLLGFHKSLTYPSGPPPV